MIPCPCANPTAPPTSKRKSPVVLLALVALALLVVPGVPALALAAQAQPPQDAAQAQTASGQTELDRAVLTQDMPANAAQAQVKLASAAAVDADDRGLSPAALPRYVIVKAVGQGVGPKEAEQKALLIARLLAAKRYAALGGDKVLDLSPQGMRIIASHATLPMGLATVRAVVLVELRLRPLPEPPPVALGLPVLRVNVDATPQVIVESNRPCEVLIAIDSGSEAEPEFLPGGSGAVYRLAPGKPMLLALPPVNTSANAQANAQANKQARLRVQACTGGLAAPSMDASLDETFARARAGRSRLSTLEGVVSECVEARAALPNQAAQPERTERTKQADMPKRSLRQKSPQAPVNMTGAAGREAGLPVPNDPGRNQP